MPQPTLSDVHVNSPLTDISVAFIQESRNYIAPKVFPVVPVSKQADRYFKYNRTDFLRQVAQMRAPGTESAGGGMRLDNTPSYYCDMYAVHKDIPDQLKANADAALNLERDTTIWATQQLMMKRDQLFATNYFSTGVWATDRQGVGAGPAGTQFLQWDAAGSTPIEDIYTSRYNMVQATGYAPNVLVLGADTFKTLVNHPDVLDRIKYTQQGVVSEDLLANLVGVDRVVVAFATNVTSAEGAAAETNAFICNSKGALLCYSAPAPSLMQPSAGYIFSWTGYLGAGSEGNRIRRFRMEQLAADRIEGELAMSMEMVSSNLGVFFYDTIA